MARRPLLLLSTLTLLAGYSLVSGCGSDKGFSTGTADDSMGAGSGSAADCTATFTWWQKDAYLNSPGRNDPAWPPHTTTELQVSCGGQVVATASMTNHGTPFGTTNDAGVPMLTDMQQATVSGTQAQLTSLLSTYQACECDPTSPGGPGTVFLSAQPPSPVMGQVLSIVESYLEQNLTCTAATSVTQIGNMLEAGNFDGARAAISGCTWSSGASFEAGLDQAASTVSGELASVLTGYHVCNNDAMLQANLFSTFQSTGAIAACDKTSSVCKGPEFFYNPASGGAAGGGGSSEADGAAPANGDSGSLGSSDAGAPGAEGGGFDPDAESTDGGFDSGPVWSDGGDA
jgi:hypothetical protein